MRPERSSGVLLALLLANAVAILFFRFFITVDGPLYALHASLFDAPWTERGHLAHGIIYKTDALHPRLGHGVLMILLLFLSPTQAHDVFAVLVNSALMLSVVGFLRVHGTRMGLAILWLAPVTFNILLVMGLFHFLLGVAMAFGSVAWWKWRRDSRLWRWSGLLIGVSLSWFAHRGAPILLCVLFLLMLFVELHTERRTTGRIERRTLGWSIAFIVAIAIATALRVGPAVRNIVQEIPTELPALRDTFLLRPLFLLDHSKEVWLVGGIGVLLSISFCAGVWVRWRLGRKLLWHDTLLACLLLLAMLSWIYGTPTGQRLFITERCQWLALLALAIWLAAIADARCGWTAHTIRGAAICALPLHIARLVQAEGSFAQLQHVHLCAMQASDALAPGSLVVPVMAEPNPMLQHLEAYVAIDHDGILVAPDEHLVLKLPSTMRSGRLRTEDPAWLMRHWRKGIPPVVDQILFMGSGIERTASRHPWPTLLGDRFRLSFDNGYSRIYTAVPG